MQHIPGLYIAEDREKGRGVYTSVSISPHDLIEICPVITLPAFEKSIIHRTGLHDYYFLWGKKLNEIVIALGYGSLYNHALYPNANFILDLVNKTIDIKCIEPILPGEEITLNYNGESGNSDPLWFETVK